jgi:hypothetical protein
MDAALAELVRGGQITREAAMSRAGNPPELTRMLSSVPAGEPSLAGIR